MIQDTDCDEDLVLGSIFCSGELDEVVIVANPGRTFGPIQSMIIYYPISFLPPDRVGGGGDSTGCPQGYGAAPDGSCVKLPCVNASTGKANPLADMRILGSKNNGVAGGRYGWARKTKKIHNGIDLIAPYGTPVFAMRDGFVSTAITGWPNSDSNAAGNRVSITSNINGVSWRIGFWHLGQVLVSTGDFVHAGQIIGYTGATGNVTSADSAGPHLHVTAQENGSNVDPEPLLEVESDGNGNIKNKC